MNLVKTRDEQAVSRVHHELIQTLVDTGNCPTRFELAGRLGMPVAQVEELLVELSDLHGVVLHPHICEPWLVHPFSTTPTAHWVEGPNASWWAPCIWCAFGIATLVGGETRIQTRIGAEAEPLVIRFLHGQPVRPRTCGYISRFPQLAPGKTFISIARWSSLSVRRKTFFMV